MPRHQARRAALGARSGRLQSVDEFAALLRSCARPVASNSPEEAAGENSPLPEALRAALADWPSYAGAPATPRVMPPAAVLAVATAAAHLVRRAPRRHLHGLRKHLVEGGGLLALIALLYAPLPPEAEPPEAAAAADGDAAAAASANPVVHAAMLALGEVCCDSEATKTAVLSLVTADELLALHRRAPPPLRPLLCDLCFELACTHSFRRVLGRLPPAASLFEASAIRPLSAHTLALARRGGCGGGVGERQRSRRR